MNLVTHVEKMKAMVAAGIMPRQDFEEALRSPAFIWQPQWGKVIESDIVQFMQEELTDGEDIIPNKFPYQSFRVVAPENETGDFLIVRNGRAVLYRAIDASAMDQLGEAWVRVKFNVPSNRNVDIRLWLDGEAPVLVTKDQFDARHETAKLMMIQLLAFIADTMLPSSVIVKVSPDNKPGKSVEWRQSRTHFLILNRHTAEECRRQCGGPTGEQIVRSAHRRIAHFRVLHSERFKNKRGQRIPVKESWVGPDEWNGKDGKVYRVIHK